MPYIMVSLEGARPLHREVAMPHSPVFGIRSAQQRKYRRLLSGGETQGANRIGTEDGEALKTGGARMSLAEVAAWLIEY